MLNISNVKKMDDSLDPDTTVVLYDSRGEPSTRREINKEEKSDRVIRLKEIDLNDLEPMDVSSRDGAKYIFVGRPKSGKSLLIKSVLRAKSFIPCIQIHSGTESSNKSFSQNIPETFIFNKLNNDAIAKLIAKQKYAINYNFADQWACLVCDDTFDHPSCFKQPIWLSIFKNSRHWKLLTLIAMQYVYSIYCLLKEVQLSIHSYSPKVQKNIRRKIYDNFGSVVGNYRDFCDIMSSTATEEHRAIVFKNMETSNKLEERIGWVKSNLNVVSGDWRFGSPSIWKHCEKRKDPDYKEDVY